MMEGAVWCGMGDVGAKAYAAQQVQSRLGQMAGTTPPKPMPALTGLVNEINQRISAIQDRQITVGNAIDRIIIPRPVNVAGECEKVAREPQNLEEHLHVILRRLEDVFQAESSQADTLNGVI